MARATENPGHILFNVYRAENPGHISAKLRDFIFTENGR